jgi:hypothetical protein
MIFTRSIDSQTIIIECDEALEPAAGDVLKMFADLAAAGTRLREGLRVRFGWSMLTLRVEDDRLRVCEPLFSGDPRSELNPKLTITLSVIAEQVKWLHRVQEKGTDVVFDQRLVHTGAALEADEIFALRGESASEIDSGWSVAPVPSAGKQIDTSNLSSVPIYRLLSALLGAVTRGRSRRDYRFPGPCTLAIDALQLDGGLIAPQASRIVPRSCGCDPKL